MYKPIEIVDEQWVPIKLNPPAKQTRKRYPRSEVQAFDNFDGLEIRLALIRPPNYDASKEKSITSSQAAYSLVRGRLESEHVENFVVLVLSVKNTCMGIYVLSRGSTGQVEVSVPEIFRPVLVAGGASFIVAHNHPSGDPEPSPDDFILTGQIKRASDLMKIPLLDHIIVGSTKYVSLADRGRI